MLTSPQIKTVTPHDKKPGISDRSSFCVGIALNFNSFGRNCVTTFGWPPLTVRRAVSYPASRVASILPRLVRKEDNRRRLCSQGRPHWKIGDCEQSTLGAAGIDWCIKLHACTCSEPPTERKKHRAWSLWSIECIWNFKSELYFLLYSCFVVFNFAKSCTFLKAPKHAFLGHGSNWAVIEYNVRKLRRSNYYTITLAAKTRVPTLTMELFSASHSPLVEHLNRVFFSPQHPPFWFWHLHKRARV